MSKERVKLAVVGLVLFVVLTLAALALFSAGPGLVQVQPQGAATTFTDLAITNNASVGGDLTVTGGATAASFTGDVTGDLTGDVTGDLTGDVAGDLTGALVLGADDFVTLTPGTSITVTNGAAFTPTATYQPLVAAAEVTPTITAGATAGRLVALTNTGTDVINLADSGTLKLSAAAALGQYDVLVLVSDGTNWIEISRSDN